MPRSTIFSRLLEASAIAGESFRRNTPVDALFEEREQIGMSRRKFIAATVAAGAITACGSDQATGILTPRAAVRGKKPASTPRVAIVGAGLAGLTCAYRLKQSGITATVYEASDRLGGRCWSNRGDFADGQIAEHGGELIDQSHTEIRHLAQELGLSLDNLLSAEVNGTEPFYFFDGSPYPFSDATRDIKAIWQTVHRDLSAATFPTLYTSFTQRGWELDHMSVAQWIDSNVPGGRQSKLGQLLETAYIIEYGADATDQSALNLIYLIGYSGQGQLRIFGPSNEKYHVRGGNDLIVQRLVSSLAATQIETENVLVAIAQTASGGFDLTFDHGGATRVISADHVVLALPFSVMRSMVNYTNAGFTDVKRTAIAELGMGANAKLNVQFSKRSWATLGSNGETYADTGYQNTWEASRGQSGKSGILVQYTGGSVALAQGGQSANALVQQFLPKIEPVLPGLSATWNQRATIDWWPGNPWTKGSYAYWKVGQYTKFAGAEGARSGNCHFAGEHTSIESQGYLNGAVESGERVTKEILADVKALA